jgi:hypothetical protein
MLRYLNTLTSERKNMRPGLTWEQERVGRSVGFLVSDVVGGGSPPTPLARRGTANFEGGGGRGQKRSKTAIDEGAERARGFTFYADKNGYLKLFQLGVDAVGSCDHPFRFGRRWFAFGLIEVKFAASRPELPRWLLPASTPTIR